MAPPESASDDYGDPLLPNQGIQSPQKKRASQRNATRLARAQQADEEIMSKYLTGDPSSFITSTLDGPDDYFEPPAWLMTAVGKVATTPVTTPHKPSLQFSMDREAATHNSELLRRHNFNLENLIHANRDTTMFYGPEFRPIAQLASILGLHPHFAELSRVLTTGMDYRFTRPLPTETQQQEVAAMMLRGNHNRQSTGTTRWPTHWKKT